MSAPPSRRPSDIDGSKWPSRVVMILAKRLYDDLVHRDPEPGDCPWEMLSRSDQESYYLLVTTQLQILEWEVGLVTGAL